MKNRNAFHVILLSVSLLMVSFILSSTLAFGKNQFKHNDNEITPTPTSAPVQKSLTFRTWTSAHGLFNGSGLAVPLSQDILPGDLLIAVAATNGPVTSWSTPDGWTQGTNTDTTNAESLHWWWKIADGSEAGTTVIFQSGAYADGGIVVNVYEGQAANPIAGISNLTTTDNNGVGHVTSAPVAGISLGAPSTAVSLLFAGWQPYYTTLTFPQGFGFESTADDGYSYVGVAESYYAQTTSDFPSYLISLSQGEAVVQTLQVIVNVR